MARNEEQSRKHYCPVDPALYSQQHFAPRSKTGLKARECGTSKINLASDLLGALTVCYEHQVEALECVNFHQGLTIRQDGLVLLTTDECRHPLGLRGGSVAVNRFKQVLHFTVATAAS